MKAKVVHLYIDGKEIELAEFMDCIGVECAWYDINNHCCYSQNTSNYLHGINTALYNIHNILVNMKNNQ